MVGHFVRLQLRLTGRSLTASTGRIVATVVLGLNLCGALVGALAVMVLLGTEAARPVRGPLLTLAMAVFCLAVPLASVLTGGQVLLDPARYALMPRRGRELVPAMFVTALLGVGSIVSLVLSAGAALAWRGEPLPLLMVILQCLIGTALCVLLTRVLLAVLGPLLARRRIREALSILTLLGIIAVGSLAQFVAVNPFDNVLTNSTGLTTAARVAGATPFGWCWSLAWDAQEGAWVLLAAHLGGSLVLIGLLLWSWARLLDRALAGSGLRQVGGTRVRGRGVSAVLPRGVTGALMGRELRYWRRDQRRLLQIIGAIVLPFIILLPALLRQENQITAAAPFLCAVVTSSASAWGLSYDGSAL